MEHPYISFYRIDPDPIFNVDRCQSEGKDIIAVGWKLQARPRLPVGDRPFDLHRAWLCSQDGCPHTTVNSYPRIEGHPIFSLPVGVFIDRNEGVAILPTRPNRRHQGSQSVAAGGVAQCLKDEAAQATSLNVWSDFRRQCRKGRCSAAVFEGPGSHRVDSGGQIAQGSIPEKGNTCVPEPRPDRCSGVG